MAIKELLLQPQPLGEQFLAGRALAGPASYPTGGYLVAARIFSLLSNLSLVIPETTDSTGTYFVRVFRVGTGTSNSVVIFKWYVIATGLEVANTTNLSAASIRVMVTGN